MKIKIFTADQNGNILISKSELEELLNEAYWEGYKDCKPSSGTITTTPYYTWSTSGGNTITTLTSGYNGSTGITINASDLTSNISYKDDGKHSISLKSEV